MSTASLQTKIYWQAKIWGILHDPVLKSLHNNTGRGGNSFWQQLPVMKDWLENKWNPEISGGKLLAHIKLADYIASASDRGAIGSVTNSVNYNHDGLKIAHLLSGAKLNFKIKQHESLISKRLEYLSNKEQELLKLIPKSIENDEKQVFWWLWRCLPEAVFQQFDDHSFMLMPAETRLPDSSIWSHASMTSALAGALTGYDATADDLKRWNSDSELSHPYLVTFSFTPVQELIKASRKMRDFWAGSWILHYIAAKVCFKLALQYGPDSLLYPSLFQQPLIDHWLLQKYPQFAEWIKQPCSRDLLTAGFPNVIVMILPQAKVEAAMQTAEQTLKQAWQELGDEVFDYLQSSKQPSNPSTSCKQVWMKDLQRDSKSWQGWLKSQWQFYWAGVPIGVDSVDSNNQKISFKKTVVLPTETDANKRQGFQDWLDIQNQAYNLVSEKQKVFLKAELEFLQVACQKRWDNQQRKFSVNAGSWWSSIFGQTRYALSAVKNARSWQLPTAFAPRSTVSGIGPVVHPLQQNSQGDWVTEGETKKHWQRHAGLFDGREQLNAAETVKRGLEKVLPKILGLDNEDIAASYPDLTAGVAGYLKVMEQQSSDHWQNFQQACDAVMKEHCWTEQVIKEMRSKWGIPWIDNNNQPKRYHPRLLNAGWLVEDADIPEIRELEAKLENEDDENIQAELRQEINKTKQKCRQDIQKIIDHYYPSANPSDWYVLAAGDGDGMSEWLKGNKMQPYRDYVPTEVLQEAAKNSIFDKFLDLPKHMGPSTHNALSRALLDFSNQLVPYLTEQRHAGRLIYAGGDDVLAYTNLWEWNSWLWDIRQCFKGAEDPGDEFKNDGDYWQVQKPIPNNISGVAKRPLFTMGRNATISFGVVIAHHSVPVAIALENLWSAEAEAKQHLSPSTSPEKETQQKDAVQVRVLYGNGNVLKATAKFQVFEQWQKLLDISSIIECSIFEQAANQWNQHPAPLEKAIQAWTQAFCSRREQLKGDESIQQSFQEALSSFLKVLWQTTPETELTTQVQTWLKLAAFTLRNRNIKMRVRENVLV